MENSIDPDQLSKIRNPHCFVNRIYLGSAGQGLTKPMNYNLFIIIWASLRQNLSSVFQTKRDSNQSAQLQRLIRILKFCVKYV